MEIASFTIEFPEHVSAEKRQYCLDCLKDYGALVEAQEQLIFRVTCSKPRQLAYVGWALFNTHIGDLCKVTSSSGTAEARKSAYPKPSRV